MKTIGYITIGILIGLLASGLLWLTARAPAGEPITLLPTPTLSLWKVYVTGAVLSPGVYSLPPGSRVEDAVQAAGGFAPGAQAELVNLAAVVWDGAQVHVPGQSGLQSLSGRLNINTATAEELESLPGIGPTTAQKIVEYRLQHGPFRTIQDIQNVPGVGPATFAKIQNYITVGP